MQEYPVRRNGVIAGKVMLSVEGLYCKVRCLCKETGEILKLVDRRETGDIGLGICGPVQGGFGVEKKIPAKNMNCGEYNFILLSQAEQENKFYAFDEPLPDDVLQKPETFRFFVRDNRVGILIGNCQEYTRCHPSEGNRSC